MTSPSGNPEAVRPGRLVRLVVSVLIVWHLGAMLIGPAPGSWSMAKVYPVWKPYLRLLHLENYWAFFAPDPSAGKLVRYAIEDDQGQAHFFKLTEELSMEDPLFLRHSSLLTDIDGQLSSFTLAMADYLARKHADLNPQRIQFAVGWQHVVPRQAFLDGARPLDDDYMSLEIMEPISLPVDYAVLTEVPVEEEAPE